MLKIFKEKIVNFSKIKWAKQCRDPGSNRGPLDLQSNALPTELSRQLLLPRKIKITILMVSHKAWANLILGF